MFCQKLSQISHIFLKDFSLNYSLLSVSAWAEYSWIHSQNHEGLKGQKFDLLTTFHEFIIFLDGQYVSRFECIEVKLFRYLNFRARAYCFFKLALHNLHNFCLFMQKFVRLTVVQRFFIYLGAQRSCNCC